LKAAKLFPIDLKEDTKDRSCKMLTSSLRLRCQCWNIQR